MHASPHSDASTKPVHWREDLLSIAERLYRLTPDWRDPEYFLMRKSALVRELRVLANKLAPHLERR